MLQLKDSGSSSTELAASSLAPRGAISHFVIGVVWPEMQPPWSPFCVSTSSLVAALGPEMTCLPWPPAGASLRISRTRRCRVPTRRRGGFLEENWGKDEGVGRLDMWRRMARSWSLAWEKRAPASPGSFGGSRSSMDDQIQQSVSGLRERSTYAAEKDGGGWSGCWM